MIILILDPLVYLFHLISGEPIPLNWLAPQSLPFSRLVL